MAARFLTLGSSRREVQGGARFLESCHNCIRCVGFEASGMEMCGRHLATKVWSSVHIPWKHEFLLQSL